MEEKLQIRRKKKAIRTKALWEGRENGEMNENLRVNIWWEKIFNMRSKKNKREDRRYERKNKLLMNMYTREGREKWRDGWKPKRMRIRKV